MGLEHIRNRVPRVEPVAIVDNLQVSSGSLTDGATPDNVVVSMKLGLRGSVGAPMIGVILKSAEEVQQIVDALRARAAACWPQEKIR